MMIPTRENGDSHPSDYLPPGWERAYDTRSNRYFYVDHNTKTTTWVNPIDRYTRPKNIDECFDNSQLPYGWERVTDPAIGVYYIDHINRKNQWSNPVSDWHRRLSMLPQNHYSNSHILSMEQSGNSLDSNNHTASLTTISKPESSFQASDIEKSATSLNNSTSLSTDIIDSTQSNASTRIDKFDLLDIMDNCFGRESSESVEV